MAGIGQLRSHAQRRRGCRPRRRRDSACRARTDRADLQLSTRSLWPPLLPLRLTRPCPFIVRLAFVVACDSAHALDRILQRASRLHLYRVLARGTVPVSTGFKPPNAYNTLGRYTKIVLLILHCVCRQVLENIRNQSVEGLALPFLINWLLGEHALKRATFSPHRTIPAPICIAVLADHLPNR